MSQKFILTLSLIIGLTFMAFASHLNPTYITYRSLANQPGHGSLDYEIEAAFIGTLPLSIDTILNIGVRSTCTSLNIFQIPLIKPNKPSQHYLDSMAFKIDPTSKCDSANNSIYRIYLFRGNITLSAKCSNFEIYPILNYSSSRYFQSNIQIPGRAAVYATLNNLLTPNSLPTPYWGSLVAETCPGALTNLFGFTMDPDTSQGTYSHAQPKHFLNSSPQNDPIIDTTAYINGFSLAYPLPHDTNIGLQVSRMTGSLYFKASQPAIGEEHHAMSMLYLDHKTDLSGNSFLAGSMHIEGGVVLHNSCSSSIMSGPTAHFNNKNSSTNVPCGTKKVNLHFSQPLLPASLDTNGTNFRAFGTNNRPLPIINAKLLPGNTLVEIEFFQAQNQDDTIRIYFKDNQNSSPLMNNCGFPMTKADTLQLIVQCNNPVGIPENPQAQIEVFPNPSSGTIQINNLGTENLTLIKVLNLNGKLVAEFLNPESRLKLDHLPDGIYFIYGFYESKKAIQKRLVVQKTQ